MNFNIDAMSISEILFLKKQLEEKLDKTREEIETQHHTNFIKQVGLDILMNIPKVSAETLGLQDGHIYPQGIVTPKMLGNKSVVRGIDAINRPFVAIKVNLFDYETGIQITQVVELIFKRYSLVPPNVKIPLIFDDNYVTALCNKDDDGNSYISGLYNSGGMIDSQYARVGQLLRGEKIKSEFDSRFLMQMV